MGLFDTAKKWIEEQKKKITPAVQQIAQAGKSAVSKATSAIGSLVQKVTPKPAPRPISTPAPIQSRPVIVSKPPSSPTPKPLFTAKPAITPQPSLFEKVTNVANKVLTPVTKVSEYLGLTKPGQDFTKPISPIEIQKRFLTGAGEVLNVLTSYPFGGALRAGRELQTGTYQAPKTGVTLFGKDVGKYIPPALVGAARGIAQKQPLFTEAPASLGLKEGTIPYLAVGLGAELLSPGPGGELKGAKALKEAGEAKLFGKVAKAKDIGEALKAGRITAEEASLFGKGNRVAELLAKTGEEAGGITLRKAAREVKKAVKPIEAVAKEAGPLERGFVKTVRESPITKKELAEQISGTYTRLTNSESMTKAAKIIEDKGYEIARNDFFKAPASTETNAVGLQLITMAQNSGKFDDAGIVAKELVRKATESGQAAQIFAVYNKLTPEGMLRYAVRELNEANENLTFANKILGKAFGTRTEAIEVTAKDAEFITNTMKQAQGLAEGPEKTKLITQVLEYINQKIPPSFSEVFDAFRYQNLLSSPRTQERNIWGNLFQALFVRPAVLGTSAAVDWVKANLTGSERQYYIKMVPEYYKGLLNALPNASQAFMNVWRGITDIQQADLARVYSMRQNVLPDALTIVPRLMEGADKYFRALVSGGEFAARKAVGLTDELALVKADEVAQYSLLRSALDPTGETGQGFFLSKIDQATKLVIDIGRKAPFVRWFVPFVTTPMNFAKQWIQYSPAGFLNLATASPLRRTEELSKALIGSSVMGIGATYALQGKTSWSVPTDSHEKELFYAAGRRPYSVNINGTWVPMIYFGPWAFALAIPAAFKQYQTDTKTALTDNQIEKMGKAVFGLSQFFGEQTFLSGIGNLGRMLGGDIDFSGGRQIAGLLGQVIPAESFLRWATQIIDPVFRKTGGDGLIDQAINSLKAQLPFLSKTLPPYIEPTGEESKRNWTDYLLPFSMEQAKPEYEELLKARQGKLQESALDKETAQTVYEQLKQMKSEGASEKEINALFRQQKPAVQSEIKSLIKEGKPTKFIGETARSILGQMRKMKEEGASPQEIDALFNKQTPEVKKEIRNMIKNKEGLLPERKSNLAAVGEAVAKMNPFNPPTASAYEGNLEPTQTPFNNKIQQVFGDRWVEATKVLEKENGRYQTGREIDISNEGYDTPSRTKQAEFDVLGSDGMWHSIDRGLFRINNRTFADYMRRMSGRLAQEGITSYDDMLDPEKSIRMAKIIYDYQGWGAWVAAPDYLTQGGSIPIEEMAGHQDREMQLRTKNLETWLGLNPGEYGKIQPSQENIDKAFRSNDPYMISVLREEGFRPSSEMVPTSVTAESAEKPNITIQQLIQTLIDELRKRYNFI